MGASGEREASAHGAARSLALPQPYLLFLGDTTEPGYAKTAFGLRDWAPERCVGEFALPSATVTTGLPRLSPREAKAAGARSLVIGVANSGGFIAETWVPALVEALEAGLDIVSGMHARLADILVLREAAGRLGRQADRCPQAAERNPGRDRAQAQRQAPADRRHRLRAGQEIYRAGAGARAATIAGSTPISAPPGRPGS